jgi:predicted dehydrogenase
MERVSGGPARFRAGLLGVGNIGAGWDVPGDAAVATHLKACLSDPRFELAMMSDADSARAAAERDRFKANADIVDVDAILAEKLDVLCIATPDETHMEYARACNARVVLVEKPVGGTGDERRGLLDAIRRRGGILVVHHQRRWIPGLEAFMANARLGEFGRPVSGVVHYTRGLRHNGVHAFDLVAAAFGTTVGRIQPLGVPIFDRGTSDPTSSFLLEVSFSDGVVPILCVGVDGRRQTAFSVDMRFELARLVIDDENGIRATFHRPQPISLPGYAPELREEDRFQDSPPRLVASVWQSIGDHLEGRGKPPCSDESMLAVYELTDAIEAALGARSA